MPSAKNRTGGSVVLVGRPNVGKSTLFNRVAGSRRAIVTPVPGTTRDVMRESVEWLGTVFELVDTGGLYGASADPMQQDVSQQGLKALATADLIVLLVDGREGLVPADTAVAQSARRVGKPVIVAVNKVDDPSMVDPVGEFHRLGIDALVAIAAEHGLGIGDLLDEVVARLPSPAASDALRSSETAADEISVAIVGRPNVGKSSLVNLLAREQRVLVSETPGTTRDAIDTVITWYGQRVRLVDTAGIRRPGRVARSGQIEAVSVTVARRAMKRADVAVVVIDASTTVAHQDATVAGEAERVGCGIVIAANKWDLVKTSDAECAKRFDQDLREALKFAEYAPVVHLSALTGHRAPKLLEAVRAVAKARSSHIATGELNRFLERVTKQHPPASPGKKEVKIHYGTQVATRPPGFLIFTNTATKFHFSYDRFLKNRLRESFNFVGTPIRLQVRARRGQAGKKRAGAV